jgi:hypothetical protein
MLSEDMKLTKEVNNMTPYEEFVEESYMFFYLGSDNADEIQSLAESLISKVCSRVEAVINKEVSNGQ